MRFAALLFILMTLCLPATAGEPLIFREHIKGPRGQSVLDFLKIAPSAPYLIAPVDLNGDGADEWIVRQSSSRECDVRADCPYSVVGLSDQIPVMLATFAARKVGISDEKAYGVRTLLVYNQKNNDFAFQSYVWNPLQAAYRPE